MVVRGLMQDGLCAVELFKKNEPCQFMGEGHLREGKGVFGFGRYVFRYAKRSAHNKTGTADAVGVKACQKIRKGCCCVLLTPFIEKNENGVLGQRLFDAHAFLLFALRNTCLGIAFFEQGIGDRTPFFEALQIFLASFLDKALFQPADTEYVKRSPCHV